MSDVTRLLAAMGNGDPCAQADLLQLVYDELRRLARAQMLKERVGHTLQATALVHEVFLRLVDGAPRRWDGRRHFFGIAAEAMRRILVEHAREKGALKRGGGQRRIDLDDDALPPILAPVGNPDDVLAMSEALDRLVAESPTKAELVKLLYFGGLSLDEAAAALGISRSTAYRDWVYARAWLHNAIGRE